jgi:hypothetical protein
MTYRFVTSAAFVIGCAAALHAQAPTGNQRDRTVPAGITLTGCVERADQVAGNVTTATTVDSLSFVLIKATKGTAAEARPTGTGGTQSNSESGSMYRLVAETSKLNPHVGHKVEVTGTLDAASAPTGSTDSTSAANAPSLRVESVKMVSETCGR